MKVPKYLGNEELTPHIHKPNNTQPHAKNTCMQQQQQQHMYATTTTTIKKEYLHLGLSLAMAPILPLACG